jgi:hypothetical protein
MTPKVLSVLAFFTRRRLTTEENSLAKTKNERLQTKKNRFQRRKTASDRRDFVSIGSVHASLATKIPDN